MATLAFGVLGPLEIRCGDTDVAVPRPRERILLAALLADHGRVVSVDRLIWALWGEQPPGTARRQVAICVSRLRSAFAAAGAGARAIATSPPGYLVTGGWLDATRFEEYAAQAHAARAAGRLPEAARLLSAGLSLWRGRAFDGIDRPFAEIEAARLEERRIAVTSERIGLELDLGRHEEMIGELLTLVAADPVREQTRAQLMLALYRAGRRAEALEVYRSGRRLLAESLGLEPGPELQRLWPWRAARGTTRRSRPA